MSGKREIDEISGVEVTGHEWDGIKELNNPLPRWWLYTLYGTIIWSLGYVVVYPAIPGLTDATKGLWGWSSRADIRNEMNMVAEGQKAITDKISAMDITAIMADPEVRAFAISAGASTFKVNCVQCHGSGAQGGPGYPNLNDDSWLWGGTPEAIVQTIQHGIRDPIDPDTRITADMPAFGKDGMLTPEQISQVGNYVLKIAGLGNDEALATPGAEVFKANCASCHGDNGEGKQDMGAPQLNDAVWLFGGTLQDITHQLNTPRHGVMPAWEARLGDTKVKELAAYVLSLGGGQ
ncbi:MAG: cytochrome-c oxidase, cbb3-type subunit III [Proteobacteria bacterium]|nr:cytochrome-c oxidase, cbb3-type subunit III [Pseudomonadota bacterium]